MDIINTVGRRKTSVARLYITPGKAGFVVNGQNVTDYFRSDILETIVKQPFAAISHDGDFEVKVNVRGGGFKGQAEAIRLALSRALVEINEEYKPPLKKEGFLTRDPRMVERKKYGKRKARRRFQFSKR
jgi:small subunit ribosomal protein S9